MARTVNGPASDRNPLSAIPKTEDLIGELLITQLRLSFVRRRHAFPVVHDHRHSLSFHRQRFHCGDTRSLHGQRCRSCAGDRLGGANSFPSGDLREFSLASFYLAGGGKSDVGGNGLS